MDVNCDYRDDCDLHQPTQPPPPIPYAYLHHGKHIVTGTMRRNGNGDINGQINWKGYEKIY